ncbi:hypothetical protein [Thermosporothrix hazakensis]|nr:hypothetical protein [Thermosporothrix hazakensis]
MSEANSIHRDSDVAIHWQPARNSFQGNRAHRSCPVPSMYSCAWEI